ncbi:hypothetical protein DITRI_Ditri09bG0093800 [Diplodiscus trichospermus]
MPKRRKGTIQARGKGKRTVDRGQRQARKGVRQEQVKGKKQVTTSASKQSGLRKGIKIGDSTVTTSSRRSKRKATEDPVATQESVVRRKK